MTIPRPRRPARQRPAVSHTKSMYPPIGGLNARDAINGMPVKDALILTNWIAQQYGVRSRKGYIEWATNMTGEIRTIFEYAPDRASVVDYKLFGCTDANIYDITTSSNAPPVSLALGGTDECGRFSSTMMANIAGNFLLIAAHVGGYKYFDGTAWTTPAMGGGAGQIGNVDPAKFSYVQMWKRRAWFHEFGTTNVWYLPVDSITGAAAKLDVGPQFEHGGIIAFIARWSIDAGEGIDDLLVIGGENGDILIYKGTDPASSTTFQLVGVWYAGPLPVGHRCAIQYGGDLLVLTATGIQPLSYVTRGGQSILRSSSVDYLAKIQPLFGELLTATADQLGWEMTLSLKESLLVVQTPPNGTTEYIQYSLYTNGSTWCKFTNMSMATANAGQLGFFFGSTAGTVYQAFTGYFDNVLFGETVGNAITGVIQPAYSYLDYPGMNKQAHMIRPTFLAVDRPAVTISVIADYQQNILVAAPISGSPSGALWDIALWDVAVWGGSLNVYNDWYAAGALGYAMSPYMLTAVVGDTLLASIDLIFEPTMGVQGSI